jgi:dual specificity tyrosine-phosphorylation-regulated kinase 1
MLVNNSGPGERLNDRYVVETQLGKGSFGRVVKCFDQKEQVYVAVKIVKSKQPFFVQAQIEIEILRTLNQEDAEKWNVVRLKDTFLHHNHQCLVFELLSLNLFDLLQSTNFRGVSLSLIAKFARQLLVTLNYLANKQSPRGNGQVGVIHCDLKPENILLRTAKRSAIKVIDFGSACFAHDKVS